MDAERVFRTWRRILREPALSEAIALPDVAARGAELGLSKDEATIAAAYGAEPAGLRWAVDTYRYRLVSAALQALDTGAPLTLRALVGAGHELRELAGRYVASTGYRDDGPYLYRACAGFLAYLDAAGVVGAAVDGFGDLVALEVAMVGLMRRLGAAGPSAWVPLAERAAPAPLGPDVELERTETWVTITTAHRLTAWLLEPRRLGKTALVPGAEHFLVRVPSPDEACALSAIGAEAHTLLAQLDRPRSVRHLAASVEASGIPASAALATLREHVATGLLRRVVAGP